MASVFDLLGKVDNLHDPVPTLNQRPAVLGTVISFLALSWICAGARLYTRFFIARCPGWDDFFVVLVMISSLLLSVATCLALDHGLGMHFIQLGLSGMSDFIRAFYPANASYPMATAFIKLALLFQYLRIFETSSKLRILTICVVVITTLWGLAYSFIAWIPCIPVSAYWDLTVIATARWGFGSRDPEIFARTYESHVATNVVLDFIVFAIPIPICWEPSLGRKGRLGLLGLFALGILVNMFGIWRLITIVQSKAGTYPTLDPSFYGSVPIVLAALEIDLATICASLPVFWPVLEHRMGWIFVTHEVTITRESRRFSRQPREEDDAELCMVPPSVKGHYTYTI